MHPDKHVSLPSEELLAALRGRLAPDDRPKFDDLVKLMEGVASFDFMDLKASSFRTAAAFSLSAAPLALFGGMARGCV
jgi:hypothetical protein